MKYKLARQIISENVIKVISQGIRVQNLAIAKASKNNLKEMAIVLREIEEKGLPNYLVRRKLKGKLGQGIFLHPDAQPILKGQVIAPYSGITILAPQNDLNDSDYAFCPLFDLRLSKQQQLQIHPKRKFHPRRLYSVDVDAAKKGNFTRFINHSDKPNVEAHFLKIPSNSFGLTPVPLEIIYIARKTIRPGEQLLVSYEGEEKSYWGAMGIKPTPITPRTFLLNKSLKVVQPSS